MTRTPHMPDDSAQLSQQQIRRLVATIARQWLSEMGLADVFYDPLNDPPDGREGNGHIMHRCAEHLGIDVDNIRALRHAIADRIQAYLQEHELSLTEEEQESLASQLYDELFACSILQPLLHDDKIMEIMVNGPYAVYVERRGKLQKIDVMFDSSDHLMRTIHRMLLPLGQQVDAATPVVSARLPDGSLVHVVIPPLAIDGPSVTIRKFGENRLTIADLIRFGSLTDSMADLIEACIVSRLNILISGGTGSGKTTVLNVLARCIPDDERIVTVEEAATIQIPKEHVVRLEARPPDSSGKGAVTTRDLVQTAARMRPERIIIGELSGAEALDTIRLMSEGHDGSITTMHADTPHDALARLEMMILFNNPGVPEEYVRRLIATSIDLIVQQTRLADGQRKVSYITELRGVEQGEYVLHDIFALEITGQTPEGKYMTQFQGSPYRPQFADRIESFGFQLSPDLFQQSLSPLGRNNQSQKHTQQQAVRTTIAKLLRTGLRRIGRWGRK